MSLSETISSQLNYLAQSQNSDGGWGAEPGLPSSPMNTAEVTTAFRRCEADSSLTLVARAEEFLEKYQDSTDGGWASRVAPPTLGSLTVATSWAIHALWAPTLSGKTKATLEDARSLLLKRQMPSGAWVEYHGGAESVTATCQALLALLKLARRLPLDPATISSVFSGTAWLSETHQDGKVPFVKGNPKCRPSAAVLTAYTANAVANASQTAPGLEKINVSGLRPVVDYVLKAARSTAPSLFGDSVETREFRTFPLQYQHATIPLLIRFLLRAKEPIAVLWPFLRYLWKLQEPGNGSSCQFGGRRTTWATAHWIMAARELTRCAEQDQSLAREIPQLSVRERALVMKGGGVKGLALAGAIVELENEGVRFDAVAGTSAGAIAAVLLAAGYTGLELEKILRELNFRSFLDGKLRMLLNLVWRKSLFSGNPIRKWVDSLVRAKIAISGPVRMRHLGRRAVIFATNRNGTITFDSHGEYRDTRADFAVRCSMSIPFFFAAPEHEGSPIYDGGLTHNFPVARFREMEPEMDFVGLYLQPPPPGSWLSRLSLFTWLDIMLSRDDQEIVERYAEKIVVIDPHPITTTQFRLSEHEKDFLVWTGRAAARRFLQKTGLQGKMAVAEAEARALHYRELAVKARSKRRRRRITFLLLFTTVAIGVFVARALVSR